MFSHFKGGIHFDDCKRNTFASPIEKLPPSNYYLYPLKQHIGEQCIPIVNIGDEVKLGQRLADSDSMFSAPIFSSVSGKVVAIEPRENVYGFKTETIVIENDFKDTTTDNLIKLPENKKCEEYTSEEIIDIAKNAGLVGMGGAAFPTAFKLQSSLQNHVHTLIINGSECEPYLTSDHRAMIEYPRFIIGGIKLIMQCLHLNKATIVIEDNKKDAIETIKSLVSNTEITVKSVKTKYPQGGEKQLIKTVAGFELPPGKLPLTAGVAVFNVDTCASLYRAAMTGFPLVKRIVTVSGDMVKSKKNLLVRLGTPISELFEYCGGFKSGEKKIIIGGPMMGLPQHCLDVPINKSSSGLLALSVSNENVNDASCIRCGKCIQVCPMRLMPSFINLNTIIKNFEECKKLNVTDCIECGCCAYSCPQRISLVQSIRIAKEQVKLLDKKEIKK